MPVRSTSASWLGLGLSLLLTACSQAPTAATEPDPYANGASFPWSFTAPAGGLAPQSLTSGVNTLQYETPTFMRNAWGPVEKNRSNGEQLAGDGRPLTLNGQVYSQGFGVHAGSELRFNLVDPRGVPCHTFTAEVGVDDEVGDRGSVIFQVFAGHTKVFDSGVMTGASATKQVNVSVVGQTELRLVATDAGNGISSDHADWADPRLVCAAQPPASGSVDQSITTSTVEWSSVALQPDGRILVYGANELRRRLPDGTPDPAFGQGGRVIVNDGRYLEDRSVLVQPDGKIIVLMSDGLQRLLPDGGVDPSFGEGGVYRRNVIPNAVTVRTAALGADGSIVVAGPLLTRATSPGRTEGWYIERLQPNGTLDTRFGNQGRAITTFSDPQGRFLNRTVPIFSAIQADGRIVVAGITLLTKKLYLDIGTYTLEQNVLSLVRYRADGSPDPMFSGDGQLMEAPIAYPADGQWALDLKGLVLQGNKLLLGLATDFDGIRGPGVPRKSSLLRYNPDGTRDASFGAQGLLPDNCVPIEDLALQADGKILVTGDSLYDQKLQCTKRLNADGSLDLSFGRAAINNNFSQGFRLLIQPDDRLLSTSRANTPTGKYQLLRFWP